MGNMIEKCAIFPAPPVEVAGDVRGCESIIWDKRESGLPAGGVCRPFLWFPVQGAEFTVIYFHANAEDLSGLSTWVCELARELCVNLLAVEYPGYGLLQVPDVMEDMETVGDIIREIDSAAVHAVRFLAETQHISSDRVLLHGRSIGCGPALRLAKYMRDQMQLSLGGIVLQSPSISVQQTASDWLGAAASLAVPAYYDNLSMLTQLCRDVAPTAPVKEWIPLLIVHGEQDNIVPPYHAWTLYQEAVVHGHPSVALSLAPLSTHEQWDLSNDLVYPISHFLAHHVGEDGTARLRQAETEGREMACGEAQRNNFPKRIPVSCLKRPGRGFEDHVLSTLAAEAAEALTTQPSGAAAEEMSGKVQTCHEALAGSLIEVAKGLEVPHHDGKDLTEMFQRAGPCCLQELSFLPL